VKNFLQLLSQAVSIVKKDIPIAKFCEADGTPSKGTAQQESDVDTWLFRFMVPPSKSASIEYEHGSFQLPVLTFQPILGDRIIPLPLKRGLKEAIKCKDAAGYKSPFKYVLLRWPLTPDSARYVFVGVNTGDVFTAKP
jgi:hypothetical protein